MKDTTLGQMWFRRHPALAVIVVLWAMIWGAMALSGNDGPGIAIAAWLVLVTPVALIAWGLGALIDRWKQRRQPGAPTQAAAPALLSPVPAAMPTTDQLHQQERNELAIERREFDGELQHSEAEQWHRLMARRHAAATRQSGSAMRMVTSAGTTALPRPTAAMSPLAKSDPIGGMDDEYCPSCGARFNPNDRFCPSCGHPRGTH